MFVHIDSGVNAGIIIIGGLGRGATGTAGNLGSLRVPDEDPALGDGVRGCLEERATLPALASDLRARGVGTNTDTDVLQLVRGGNRHAIQAVRQVARDIGDVLAAAVNLLNPSVIVIGGSITGAGEILVAGIREAVFRRSLPSATLGLHIGPSKCGDHAAVLGASHMLAQHVLSSGAVEAALYAGQRAGS